MGKSMNMPHFIVLGGHKCGTSSLHNYLAQHPEIYMPRIKGTDFFNREGSSETITSIERYQAFYQEMTNEKIAGEVSSVYLYSKGACDAIKKYLPEAKLIAVLRNPVERAFSHFNQLPETKKRDRNFSEIFDEKKVLRNGFYSTPLNMYFDSFGRDRIKILLFDSLRNDKKCFFYSIFQWVGVNPNFMPDTSIVTRQGGEIKNQAVKNIFNGNNILHSTAGFLLRPFTTPDQRRDLYKKTKNMFMQKNELPEQLRKQLIDFYREDILQLQDILDMDISHWLKAKSP